MGTTQDSTPITTTTSMPFGDQEIVASVQQPPTVQPQVMMTPSKPVESTVDTYEHGAQSPVTTPTKTGDGVGEATITLTQATLDNLIRERLARQKARLEKKYEGLVEQKESTPTNDGIEEPRSSAKVSSLQPEDAIRTNGEDQESVAIKLKQLQETVDRLSFEQMVVDEASKLGLDPVIAKRLLRREDVSETTKDAVVGQLTSLLSTVPLLRKQPPLTAPSSTGGAPQRDLQREYFGGGGNNFWQGGGVTINNQGE